MRPEDSMRSLVMLSLAAALVMLTGAGVALAQSGPAMPGAPALAPETGDADAVLAQLRESVTFARYAEALDSVRCFLQRNDLSARQRNAALEALATVQIATNAADAAHITLEELYSRDPQYRLSDADASPPVQSAFARMRDSRPAGVAVRLEQAPIDLRERESPVVAVRIAAGANTVEELRLAYRSEGETRFTRVVMALEDGIARARMPLAGDPTRPLVIDYFIEAVAPSLTPVAHLGSEAEPLVVRVPAARAPEPAQVATGAVDAEVPGRWTTRGGDAPATPADEGGSVTSKWWFWTILGVVVIGAGVGTAVAVSSGGEPPTGTLGAITLH
jgi:hypothetical protein